MSRFLFYGIFIQCMLASVLLAGDGVAQKTSIEDIYLSLDLNDITLKEAFEVIGDKTNFDFAFNDARVNENVKISVSATNKSLADVLRSISKNKKLRFKRVDEVIHVNRKQKRLFGAFGVEEVIIQQTQVSGVVTTAEEGEPLPGVSVIVEGTSQGTVTDIDGKYTIEVPSNASIQFSYIGYLSQTIEVGNQSQINVALEADVQQLEEVVVTAFGLEQEKKALGYSVTQVGGEEFTESRTINLGSALSGKVAGVNVSPPASGAAGSTRVVIRGGSSLSGNDQPLYVINGVPMDNSNLGSAGMWGGNDNGDGLSSINPDDIESISVLKGATASALYGSRASNGVILITTKGGKAGNMQVTFNSNFTVDRVNDLTDWQTEYGHGIQGTKPTTQESALANGQNSWGARLDGTNVIQFDGVERPYSNVGEGINDFYRTGHTWTNTLSFSGGNELMNYRVSASDLSNEDIVPNSGFDRRMLNANLGGKFGKLELKVTAQYSKENAQNRPRLSDSPGNANATVMMKSPAISFETLKGTTDKLGAKEDGFELRHQGNTFAQNPYWAAYQYERLDEKDRIMGNVQLKYNITDWLYIQGRVGTDVISVDFRNVAEPYGTAYRPLGQIYEVSRKIREDNADVFVGFNKEFGTFGVDVLLGGNRMRRSNENYQVGGVNLVIPFFHSVNNVNPDNRNYTYGFSEYGINSVFGSANFSYNGYLFLNVTGRQDNFSTLSKENNSIFYPSVGLSYVLSDMVSLPSAFSFAKLRASWAQVGGGTPDPYILNLTYGLNPNSLAGATRGSISNGSIPNSSLQPYLTTEYEIGADLRFFNNRLGVDVAYYDRTTRDDILSATISRSSGFGSTLINVGELNNKGVELLVRGTPVQTNDVTWEISFNMANNISEAVNLGTDAAGEPIETLNLDQARTLQERIRHDVGQPLGLIAGYRHQTINGQKVYDENGYPVRGDFEVLAEGRHPFSAGLSNSFKYKNFNLDFLIDMRSGGSIYTGTNVLAYAFGMHKETLPGRETGLTVSGVDTEGAPLTVDIPAENVAAYYGRYNDITEYFVYNASFGKLRQLSIGYTLPNSVLANTPIKSANISIVGRNLLLLWSNVPNVDPESAYTASSGSQGLEYFALPPVRNFGFNLSMSF
ncbi:SusC/RagA family TonB-linked outer membrane protein [Flexithrix dorotheae]|uniref:SusC/RagA family TonB-linked outer membrane protein n=1 Tax=Flexithrix dorotheae TaxID=70993 RepID=UPI0012FB479A|nr:SusC/RagA family TonB-linked outer membrane protein [Flexithrix dorotheae]